MTGYQDSRVIQPTVSCLEHRCSMVVSQDLIYCERCFAGSETGQDINNLIQRAQWGIIREPLFARAA